MGGFAPVTGRPALTVVNGLAGREEDGLAGREEPVEAETAIDEVV
jgi:hypothetical protein